MNKIDLNSLYKVHSGDISKETNMLSNLPREKLISTLKKNWDWCVYRTKIGRKKPDCRVIYHKVIYTPSRQARTKEEIEGFYELQLNKKSKYFTTFRKLSKYLLENDKEPSFGVSGDSGNKEVGG